MGRKKKPSSLRQLHGQPVNGSEPQPNPGHVSCPDWLLPAAKREWRRVSPELKTLGLLTTLDRAALAAYCQSYAHLIECEKKIKDGLTCEYTNKNGSTNVTAKTEVRLAQKYMLIIKTFCAEFGLTPSSRGQMQISRPSEDDPMEKLLSSIPDRER